MAPTPFQTHLTDPGPIEFEAVLEKSDSSGAACFVIFPFDLKAMYGKGNLVPVKVVYDGHAEYQGSLAKMGGKFAMLLVRKDVLATLGKSAGDSVNVRVSLDSTPREITLSDDAQSALASSDAGSTYWDSLSYSNQREYQLWIESAKRPETRRARIGRMIELLAAGKRLK